MKQKFNIITSTCVPLPLENVDTDQIIPARFLKATTREEKFFRYSKPTFPPFLFNFLFVKIFWAFIGLVNPFEYK